MKHLLSDGVHVLWFKTIPVETYFPEVGLPMGLTMHRRGYAQARAAQGVCVNACVCVCLRLFKRCHLLLVRFPSIVIKAQDSAPRTAPEERNHAGTWNVSSLGLDALGGVTRTQRGKESHGGGGVCVGGMHVSTLQALPEVPAVQRFQRTTGIPFQCNRDSFWP